MQNEMIQAKRYGGEEFLVVLPEADLEVTFSAGVAMYQKGEAIGMFIQRAVRQWYRAKEKGKNCVIYED